MICLVRFYKKNSRHFSGVFPIYGGAQVARGTLLQRVIKLAGSFNATSYPKRYAKYVVN